MDSSRKYVVGVIAACVIVGLVAVVGGVLWYVRASSDNGQVGPGGAAASAEAAKTRPAAVKGTVAKFAGETISAAEYDEAWRKYLAARGVKDDGIQAQVYLSSRYSVLMELIDKRIVDAGIKENGITVTDADLKEAAQAAAVSSIQRQFPSKEAFDKYISQQGLTPEQLRDKVAENILSTKGDEVKEAAQRALLGRKLTESISVADDDLTTYLRTAEVLHIAALYHSPVPGQQELSDPDAKDLIDKAYADLQAGSKFEDVVAKFSNGPEREEGGKAPPIQYGAVNEVFDQVCWSLKEGDTSEPFKTDTGWHIIKVIKFKQETPPTDAQQREALRQRIEQGLGEAAVAKWHKERVEAGGLEILDAALAGYHAFTEGRTEEAVKQLQVAADKALDAEKLPILMTLAVACYRAGDTQKPLDLFEKMLTLASDDDRPSVYMERAKFYLETKQTESALADLATASQATSNPMDRLRLAEIYGRSEHADLAKTELRKVLNATDEAAAINAVAQVAAGLKYTDVLDEAKKKVDKMRAATAPTRATESGA